MSTGDDRTQEKPAIGQQMMIEYKRNNHYIVCQQEMVEYKRNNH